MSRSPWRAHAGVYLPCLVPTPPEADRRSFLRLQDLRGAALVFVAERQLEFWLLLVNR